MLDSRVIWPVEAMLGEGPIWIDADAALWFVDIKGGTLHRYDPVTDNRRSIVVGGQPSFITATDTKALLVGSGDTLRLLEDERLGDPLATIVMPSHNRTNDATVDAAGRLWFGTMDDGERRETGAVHVFDGCDVRTVGGNCAITNGPAISPDGRFLYHVDTLTGTIWRFDIGACDTLGQGEIFATVEREHGNPDGVSVDADGYVWVGLWNGWEARRYRPDGALDVSVRFPCANITKIAFGGEGLRTAYATTARAGISTAELTDQPLAGALFAFDPPAPGHPVPAVRLRG